jgi:hypothetical protein
MISVIKKSKFNTTFLALIISGVIFLFVAQAAFATTFSSTYDMTYGITTKTFAVGSNHKFTVKLYPSYTADYSTNMTVYLQKIVGWGYVSWESKGKVVPSGSNSTSTFYSSDSGNYRIYVLDGPRLHMKGSIDVIH